MGYLTTKDVQDRRLLTEKLIELFNEDFSLKKAFIHFSLLLVIAMFPHWQNNIRPIFHGAIMEYHHVNTKLSEVQFVLSFEQTIYTMICQRDLFDNIKEYLPILLVASAEGASAVAKKVAVPLMKTLVLDFDDLDLSAFIYQMVLGNFNMFFNNADQNLI